jgi:hypothetical protein
MPTPTWPRWMTRSRRLVAHTDAAPPSPQCLNCGQPFGEPHPNFCPACGQESRLRPPTLREFAQQFGGAYLATEGALWRTLVALLLHPGRLTLEYLAGRRKRYVLPLRLYLTISLVVLLLMRLATTVNVNVEPPLQLPAEPRQISLRLGGGEAGVRDGKFFCRDLPDWFCRRLQRRLDVDDKAWVQQLQQLPERIVGDLGSAMFLLLPAFAALLKLVYLNRRLRFTEHLVFALHLHAFWFLALGLMLSGIGWLMALAMLAMPVYAALAARRVYGGRWWTVLLRGGLLATLYALAIGLAMSLVTLRALLD